MPIRAAEVIWHNGTLVPWHEARVHVLAHGLMYGSSVFEGLRIYSTPRGITIFRMTPHLRRLHDSARIYRMTIPYSVDQLASACRELVRRNQLTSGYIRPLAYRGYGTLNLVAGDECPIEVAIAAMEFGAYLGDEALEHGIDACVSSWTRPAPNTLPVWSKAGGTYLSSQLIAMEAARHGYVEGIGLDATGYLSEGSGENLFVVRDGILSTPPCACSLLQGITRDTVITLARHAGYAVREEILPREALYLADELFFTGTAAEISAIRSIDGMTVGDGRRGPITTHLQKLFFGLFQGESDDRWGWLEMV